jgi:thiol-disulfide isomerase/thioredoxin
MKMRSQLVGFLLLAFALTTRADEFFRTLQVKDEIYTNVTVTSTNATDIYFTHAAGMASAKLKNLSPDLQKHFHYDAAKSSEIESARRQATADYQAMVKTNTPPPATNAANGDVVAPELHGRSILGQHAPTVQIEKWLTTPPSTQGKFVLLDFWATWCEPCHRSIPELNSFSSKFGDRLVIIGITDETEADIRKSTLPHIEYPMAIDTEARMMNALNIDALPYSLLVDPFGIVRYEGSPLFLTAENLQHLLDKYSK